MQASTIATGYAASNSSGNGEGAIIFDNSKDLDLLQENLGKLEKEQEDRLAARKLAISNNQKFLTALNPDLEGIFPGDKDAILAETQKLQQMGVGHLKGGRNPQSQADLNNQMTNVAALVEVSKARNKAVIVANGIVERDGGNKFDPQHTNLKVAKLMGAPLNELSKNPDQYFNGLVQTKVPDIDDVLSEFVKKSGTKYSTSEIAHPKGAGTNEIWINDVSANMNPGQMDDLSKNYRKYPKILEASNSAWENIKQETPGVIKAMSEPYIQAGLSPVQAEQKAQDDWMHGKVLYHSAMSNKLRFSGLNESGRLNIAAARAALTEDKNILYGPAMMYARIMNQEPGAYTALMGVSPSQQTYREVIVDDMGTPQTDEYGKPLLGPPLPNVVTGVQYLPDGSIAIKTTQTESAKSEANWSYYVDPATGKMKGDVKPPAVIFNKNQTREFMTFMDANKSGIDINNMDKAYRKLGAVDATGNIDPAKYTEKYSEVFGGGMPAQKKAETQKTEKATPTNFKHKAKMGNGEIYSTDGKTWYDASGKLIQ